MFKIVIVIKMLNEKNIMIMSDRLKKLQKVVDGYTEDMFLHLPRKTDADRAQTMSLEAG
jgi:hypothetical protein